MQVLHDRFADDPRISVLAVHYDDKADRGEGTAREYVDRHGFTFPSILDGTRIREDFGITAVPTFLVVGPDGRVVHVHRGRLSDEARDEIERVARDARGHAAAGAAATTRGP